MPPKPDFKVAEPAASTGYAEAARQPEQTHVAPKVAQSFREFAELDEESEELEFAPPSAQIKRTAKRILTELTTEFPRYYMVSPDEDGGISIETIGKTGRVLVICDDNGIACFSTINKARARMRCDERADKRLFDNFIHSVMSQLK